MQWSKPALKPLNDYEYVIGVCGTGGSDKGGSPNTCNSGSTAGGVCSTGSTGDTPPSCGTGSGAKNCNTGNIPV